MWRTVGRIIVVTAVWCALAAGAVESGVASKWIEWGAGLGASLTFFAWARALSRLSRHVEHEVPAEEIEIPRERVPS
jgi:hypothetical protein